jgi:tetratricopeptide (TPR) repeat protein
VIKSGEVKTPAKGTLAHALLRYERGVREELDASELGRIALLVAAKAIGDGEPDVAERYAALAETHYTAAGDPAGVVASVRRRAAALFAKRELGAALAELDRVLDEPDGFPDAPVKLGDDVSAEARALHDASAAAAWASRRASEAWTHVWGSLLGVFPDHACAPDLERRFEAALAQRLRDAPRDRRIVSDLMRLLEVLGAGAAVPRIAAIASKLRVRDPRIAIELGRSEAARGDLRGAYATLLAAGERITRAFDEGREDKAYDDDDPDHPAPHEDRFNHDGLEAFTLAAECAARLGDRGKERAARDRGAFATTERKERAAVAEVRRAVQRIMARAADGAPPDATAADLRALLPRLRDAAPNAMAEFHEGREILRRCVEQLAAAGDHAAAVEIFRDVFEQKRVHWRSGSTAVSLAAIDLARALVKAGETTEARELLAEALEDLRAFLEEGPSPAVGDDHPYVAAALRVLSELDARAE